ncbi:MAG TPA: hypothetical protein VFB80_13155, partial [Pirellulaceae bacterium]|nr:hypothetical protein [Pirellulaceae bacterium]
MRWCCWLAATLSLSLSLTGRLAAQTAPPDPAAESPKPIAGPAVEASPLDTFLLRDSKGNLVPVPGMPFEEFERLLLMKKGLSPPAAPGFTFDALSLVGEAKEKLATFEVTATIRVRAEGWIRVPLLLPSAILRGQSRHEGPGEHFVAFDSAAGGYVCWLKGADARPHVVTLEFAAGLSTAGDDTRLALSLPRATESSLRLTVPVASIEAALTGEGLATTRSAGGAQSEISVLGPAGELQLSWHKGAAAVKGPTQLDASGSEIQVRVESQQSITSTARLKVRSYGGLLETFQVRLPPGMELAPSALGPVGYTLTPLAGSGPAPAPRRNGPGLVVEVRLDKPTPGVADVQLAASLVPEASPAPLMPARFEVLGAVRQRGTIDVSVGGQWQLEWTEDRSVRRVDLAAETSPADLVARFDYFRQPCGLQLRVAARPSRVSVEPTHLVFVDPQLVLIKSTLKYRFRGSRVTALALELGDWKFGSIMPSDLFEAPVFKADAAGLVQLPFRQDKPLPAELELTLEAHRQLAPAAEHLVFGLPRPLADIVAPATLVIAPADNVELTPQEELLLGLTPDTSGVRIPERQQPPLVYRDLGGGEPALFATRYRTRTRTSTVVARATARIDRQQLQIEQQLEYRIAHEPQRAFTLLAPRGLLSSGNLQVTLGGQPLSTSAAPEPLAPAATSAQSAPGEAVQRIEFTTPSDQIGVCTIVVRYTSALPASDGHQPLDVSVPLVIPADEGEQQFQAQTLEFLAGEAWQIEPGEHTGGEFSHPAPLPAAAGGQAFTWSRATPLTH